MPKVPARKVSRFIVMAMLQAARARRLGLDEDSAYSWGLNRAIFFAAAKQGFRGTQGHEKTGEPHPTSRSDETYFLGDEMAYRDPGNPKLLFAIGGSAQTPDDFRHQIAARFGSEANFRAAWSESSEIVGRFEDDILKSGHRFYASVYKPRRDELREEWTERFVPGAGDAPAPRVPRSSAERTEK